MCVFVSCCILTQNITLILFTAVLLLVNGARIQFQSRPIWNSQSQGVFAQARKVNKQTETFRNQSSINK